MDWHFTARITGSFYHVCWYLFFGYYRMGENFCVGLIFVDSVGPTQTMKNSLKISTDPQK